MKKYYIFLFLIVMPLFNLLATASPTPDFSNEDDNLGSWISSFALGDNTLSVFFSVEPGEFTEYIQSNDVSSIKLDFYWQNNEGTVQNYVTSETIDESEFMNIQDWGFLIENADLTNGFYLAQISINDDDCGLLFPIPLEEPEDEEEEDIDLPIELPDFACGDEFTLETITNKTGLGKANVGDIFHVGGFPILLTQVSGEAGTFSGKGIIPLPFKNKAVFVVFNSILVNTDKVVYSGQVVAQSSGTFTPSSDTLDFGGQICLPNPPPEGYGANGYDEVTGLDPWGFDANGINVETNGPYDQNGFDVNGIHKNGTPFNDAGCSREGVDADGHPCSVTAGTNVKASEFADSLSDDFYKTISQFIETLKLEISANKQSLNCDSIRDEMNTIMDASSFRREFVFGKGDKYFKKGMHLEFSKKPEELSVHIARSEDAKMLEEKHIDLYVCDKKEYYLDTMAILLNGVDANEISQLILDKIKNWTEFEYNLYHGNPQKFEDWVLREIGKVLKDQSNLDDSYFYTALDLSSGAYPIDSRIWEAKDVVTASLNGIKLPKEEYSVEEQKIYEFLLRSGMEKLKKKNASVPPNPLNGVNLLPITVSKTVGNKTYKIVITKINFMPNGASLDAYIEIEDPETNRKIVFSGTDIPIGPTGFSEGEARMELGNPVQVRLNNAARLVLKQGSGTYVAWDCNGFVSMGIDAEIEFCRNKIIPLDPSTLEPMPEPARYKLPVVIQDIKWLEFTFSIPDAPPFSVAGYEDVKWVLKGIVVDFSSSYTPQFTPMPGYASPFWDGTTMAAGWKGFYMDNLSAVLPKQFSKDDSQIKVDAMDILIDNRGFTGGVGVENVLSYSDGSLSGWPFSIDYFELRILNNHFAGAGLRGDINIPVFKDKLGYRASMYPDSKYEFTIDVKESMDMPLFLATATIEKNSSVSVNYDAVEKEFVAIATLNGRVAVETGNNYNVSLKLPSVSFTNLVVTNGKGGHHYFEGGGWRLDSMSLSGVGYNFKGFGLKLGGIGVDMSQQEEPALNFNLDINLVDALGINAVGGFKIIGKLEETGGRQKWVYDRIKLETLYIDADLRAGNHVTGYLQWYENNPVWGDGFRGMVHAKFEKIGLGLDAVATFGRTLNDDNDEYKYFFVDALAKLGKLASVGPLKLTGFGGGVSYQMSINQSNVSLMGGGDVDGLPALGVSLSGTKYTPSFDTGLILKATASVALQKEKVFNGTVSLIFAFNKGYGVDSIILTGSGHFLQDVDYGIKPKFALGSLNNPPSQKPDVSAPLSAYINITMNFTEPSFHGNFLAYLNLGGSNNGLAGLGDNGELVDATIHFDKDKWYIWVGTPQHPAGVRFKSFGNAYATAYFEIGSFVHGMPDPPPYVSEITGSLNRNEVLRRSGAGLMFGASVGVKLEAKRKLISGYFKAEAGFDVMVKKFDGVSCGGFNPIGLDGWYAVGQLWIYGAGSLTVFGYNLLKVSAAGILQIRGPRPFNIKGRIGVKNRRGKVRNIGLEFGNKCTMVGSTPEGLGVDVIVSVTPGDELRDVSTMTNIVASLALPLDKEIHANDKSYEVKLNHATLFTGEGEVSMQMDTDGTDLIFNPDYELPPNDSITFEIQVDVFENGGNPVSQTVTVSFFTGDFLKNIPAENIDFAYPVDGMLNFYKDENTKHLGYIQLVKSQFRLLVSEIPEGYVQKVRFKSASGTEFMVDYTYDSFTKRIEFPMPVDKFDNQKMYEMSIVRIPHVIASAQAASPASALGRAMMPGSVVSAPTSQSNQETASFEAANVIYTCYFRVSKFDLFIDKIVAIEDAYDLASDGGSSEVSLSLAPIELFDVFEMADSDYGGQLGGLVKIKTSFNMPTSIEQDIDKLVNIAENYPHADIVLSVNSIRNQMQNKAVDYSSSASRELILTPNDFQLGHLLLGSANQKIKFFKMPTVLSIFNEAKTVLIKSINAKILADCNSSDNEEKGMGASYQQKAILVNCDTMISDRNQVQNMALPSDADLMTSRIIFSYVLPGESKPSSIRCFGE